MVETGGLENRLAFAGYGGSNPSPSATNPGSALRVRVPTPPHEFAFGTELARASTSARTHPEFATATKDTAAMRGDIHPRRVKAVQESRIQWCNSR